MDGYLLDLEIEKCKICTEYFANCDNCTIINNIPVCLMCRNGFFFNTTNQRCMKCSD